MGMKGCTVRGMTYVNHNKLLTRCVGCTGGKHRSVTMANRLSEYFERKGDNPVALLHRDITK